MPIKWLICAVIIAAVAGMWFWRERRKRKDEAPASIVLLLKNPKSINVQVLADLLGKVTDRDGKIRAIELADNPNEKDDNKPVGDMVTGAPPHFIAQVGGTTFAIHNLAAPYMQDPANASESFPELRLRKAIRDHKAWLSMDIIPHEAANTETYRVVARVLANLVDSDCLALYHPPLNQFVPCSMDETVAGLKADDPIKVVFVEIADVPVIPIDDDPRLRAAEAEARRRFSEFERAFQNQDGTGFTIKTLVTSGGNSEHIWVDVDRIFAGRIEGRLGNDPVDLGDLKIGSKVEVGIDQVEDWAFLRGGDPVGMFTLPVFKQIQEERSAEK